MLHLLVVSEKPRLSCVSQGSETHNSGEEQAQEAEKQALDIKPYSYELCEWGSRSRQNTIKVSGVVWVTS